jgi:uncharacterized membrane protein
MAGGESRTWRRGAQRCILEPESMERQPNSERENSIDLLRGILLVLMLLDHLRDFWNAGTGIAPLDIEKTNAFLFFTRWITNLCAPGFIFLSGLSAYLSQYRKQKTKTGLMKHCLKRGLFLIFIEIFIVGLCWGHSPFYNGLFLQVIWVIGFSYILLAFAQFLPPYAIAAIGAVTVVSHNLLPDGKMPVGDVLWSMLHVQKAIPIIGHWEIWVFYPLVPWFGVMFLGYAFGVFYCEKKIMRGICTLGSAMLLICGFFILRLINAYGDPYKYVVYHDSIKTMLSFLKVEKYPPSLMYICINLGLCLLLLFLFQKIKIKKRNIVALLGRNSLFFYIVHLYFVVLTSFIAFVLLRYAFGFSKASLPFAVSLPILYPLWAAYSLAMVLLVKGYSGYKESHSNFITKNI